MADAGTEAGEAIGEVVEAEDVAGDERPTS